MKTAMQLLLKEVTEARDISVDVNFRSALDFVRDTIEWDYIEKEKEQLRTILLAYNEERNDSTDGAQNYWEPYEVDDFLEKYNETFNTKESERG